MKTYTKGEDFKERGDIYKTFGITLLDKETKDHVNIIKVYDEQLRDRVLKSLINSNKIDWHRLKCEEASMFSRNTKIDCGASAEVIIWHNGDNRAYAMCFACADHNITNRRGIELARKEKKEN